MMSLMELVSSSTDGGGRFYELSGNLDRCGDETY